MKIDVIYQFNEKYAPYAGVSVTSLLENNKHMEAVRIFILGEKLSEASILKFRQLADRYKREILFINTEEQIEKMKAAGMPSYRGSYAANLRLFLPYLVDDSIEKLLYLDADTVVTGRLDELFDRATDEYPIYMALDSLAMKHKEEIGLNADDKYFNSGVILFLMNEWKKQKLSDAIMHHVKTVRNNYPSPDQDLLNVVCCGRIGLLMPQYNFQPVHVAFTIEAYCRIYSNEGYYTREELEQAGKSPCIYHFFRFLGEFPWDKGNVHPDNELFDKYLQLSPWKDYEKKKTDLGIVFKIEKIMYLMLPRSIFLRVFKTAHRAFIRKSNTMSLKDKINPNM